MTATLRAAPVVADNGVPLLATDPPRFGAVSRRLVARFVAVLGAVELVGVVLSLAASPGRGRAVGLGLVAPGGGLLYAGRPLEAAVAVGAFVLAIVLWWGISAFWLPPLVWAATVGVTALSPELPRLVPRHATVWGWAQPVVYVAAAATVAVGVVRFERRFRAKRAAVPALNEYLATATLPAASRPLRTPTAMDAELLRWVYEMALQPVDQFRGFDWGEQFHGPTCARYQLNFLGWSLSMYAANHLPNARQPVERALANLIEKQTDLRVWGYWRTLNRIGNLDGNPDPIVRDNIMLNAYLVDQINLYEAATGSDRFDEPGSLTFVWRDGRTFAYDHHTVAEAVAANFAANELGLFPCEPGWVFTFCNVMGAQALKGHDTLHGTDLWSATKPAWRRGITEEMLTPDGNFPHIRSKWIGLSFDTGEVPGGEYYLAGTNRLADVAPDLALRGALLSLRGVPAKMAALRTKIVDGVLDHTIAPRLERNTNIRTAVLDWTALVGTARGVGEEEVAAAALARMEADCATGERWPERPLAGGVQTIGVHLLMRWSSPLGTSALALRGYKPPVGPVLADAPWPAVLVTLARSPDGRSLELQVEPGPAPTANTLPFTFDALVPGAAYRLVGDDDLVDVQADAEGAAVAHVRVQQRRRLRLEPA